MRTTDAHRIYFDETLHRPVGDLPSPPLVLLLLMTSQSSKWIPEHETKSVVCCCCCSVWDSSGIQRMAKPKDFLLNNKRRFAEETEASQNYVAEGLVRRWKGLLCDHYGVFVYFTWNNGLCPQFHNSFIGGTTLEHYSSSTAATLSFVFRFHGTIIPLGSIRSPGGNIKSLCS